MLGWAEATTTELWQERALVHRWRRLPDELSNIRAAFAWATRPEQPRAELAQRLAATMWFFFQLQGWVPEARAWLDTALAIPGAPMMARGLALTGAAFVAWMQGDDAYAEAACREIIDDLATRPEAGGPLSYTGTAHFILGLINWRARQFDRMMAELQEALALFWAINDRIGIGNCNLALGVAARLTGDRDRPRAMRHFDEAYRLHGESGYAWGIATSRYYAGETAHDAGDATTAARLLSEGLDRYWAEGDQWGAGACIAALAVLAAEREEYARAARLFGAAFRMCEQMGVLLPPIDFERYHHVAQTVVRPQVGDKPFVEGRALSPADAVEQARALAEEIAAGHAPAAHNRLKDLLTPDQYPVVDLWVQGKSVKQIMDTLSKGRSTVYGHLEGARKRLGVRTDPELAVKAKELMRPEE
jgi:DNA-binding CsgD family transcriptional regulator